MVFEAVIEPVLFAFEPDQQAGRLSMPRDDNLLGLRQAQESLQVVFHFSQRHPTHRAFRAWRASALLRLW